MANWLLIMGSIGFTILNLLISTSMGLRNSMVTAELAGYVLAPIIMALVVVLIFQIGKRFRTTRSRLKIYFWISVVLLLSNLIQIAKIVT